MGSERGFRGYIRDHAHHSLPPSHDRSFPPPLCFMVVPIRNIKGTWGSSTDHLAAELGTHLHPPSHSAYPTLQASRPPGLLDHFYLCPLPLPSGFPDFICSSRHTELTSVSELVLHSASGICRTGSHILLATAPPPVVTPVNLRTLHLSIYTTVCFALLLLHTPLLACRSHLGRETAMSSSLAITLSPTLGQQVSCHWLLKKMQRILHAHHV